MHSPDEKSCPEIISVSLICNHSGKKKSKFKTFKKFFGKRKRKETLSSESGSLKLCQSTNDVTASQSMHVDDDSEDELEIHTTIMGSRALSHDSIFISEAAQEPARPNRVFSQENVSDRIRALQVKLQQNWKLGLSSPFGTPSKRVDDAGMSSEDDGLPRSPPETSLLQEILTSSTAKFSDSHKHLSSLSLAGTGSEEEEQVTVNPPRSCSTESQLFPKQSSAKIIALQTADNSLSPPADFDAPPEFSACLDNSAAKHKLLVKPRNQRSSKMRRPPSRNLPESQNYLSGNHEEDEPESKEMPAKLTYEGNCSNHQEVTENTVFSNNPVNFKQAKIIKGIQHSLDHQNEKACTLHSVSELDLPPYENNPDNCKTVQKLLHMISLSSFGPKEDTVAPNLTPEQELQRKKQQSETLKISPGNLSAMSFSTLIQEEKQIRDVPSKNDMLPDKNNLAKSDGLPPVDNTDKIALQEDICNKGSSSLPSSSNLLPKNPPQLTEVSYSESSNASQTSCTAPSPQASLTLDKMEPTDKLLVSNKGDSHPSLPGVLILGAEMEKDTSELSPLRKFSISSARERPRTSSVNMRETVCESPLSTQVLQTKIKDFSRNETVKEDVQVNTFQEKKSSINKQALPSELEGADRVLDRPVIDTLTQTVSSKPVLNNSGTGLPQQSSTGQSGCEDKNPFQVKLRTTSLSMKYKDNSLQESKESKRNSAELNLENKGPSSSLPKSEKAEIKKTAEVNIGGFLNERTKTKSAEQSSTKPPLPRKPILQHFIIAGTNTGPEKQEKGIKYPELKNEDPVLEKKQSPSEVPEKSALSPVIAADCARESQTVPAWITIAKQKQRVVEQELSGEEKPVTQDNAEKQIKEKEKVEEPARQQTDLARNAFFPFPSTVPSEEQKKDTKSDLQEFLPKAGSLSHHSSAQSSVPVEKEDIKPLKKVARSSPDQPSWMELAKKKSQAWSDMPQMIK
ncbi:hypothetical protein lerEdw1_016540 [Lerista edwardsae]|nr:hypothetical protein lerEdw1_016540 [Lerista edwardsae]